MDWNALKRDWRIWLLVLSLLVSFVLIVNPLDPYGRTGDGKIYLKTNIEQGLDLQGGARVLVDPKPVDGTLTDKELRQIIDTLRTRVTAFGLQEMDIRPKQVGGQQMVQIELAGANTSDLTELLNRTGRFEARIPIAVEDGTTFRVGRKSYTVQMEGEKVNVGGETVGLNETFNLSTGGQNIKFTYRMRNGTRFLSGLAFTGQDMLGVDISTRVSGFQETRDGWSFRFQVSVTEAAARRVKALAQAFEQNTRTGYLTQPSTGRNAKLVFYLDNSRVSALNIRNSFQASLVQQPVITGGASTREQAVEESNQLKSVLKSGALPVPIEIVRTTRVSATLGQRFLTTAVTAIILAILAVSMIVFVRYRDMKIVLPLTVTGFSELVIIFGFAAAVNWTIDLPSIAGIIAAVGTGVDDQIIITDEKGRRELRSLKKRFKRAFFIIFTSAASTIGAMLPLTQIGAGEITGFAVTTIAGVLIGVGITRPAYARVLQYMER